MRMRKKKHGKERLDACREYLYESRGAALTDPAREVYGKDMPVYLEIGAGKGGFAVGMKRKYPDTAYFAMERVTDCVVLAAERARDEGIGTGLKFILDTADNLTRLFAPSTVDKIFLNFSDPWPKKGYAKRRLMHRRYLSVYLNLLPEGGTLRFKTDNVGLFDFALEEIEAVGLTPTIVTRDLHASEYMSDNVITEYEAAFAGAGIQINMLEIVKPKNYTIDISPDLLQDRREYCKNTDDDGTEADE